jgi:hypothetical protein
MKSNLPKFSKYILFCLMGTMLPGEAREAKVPTVLLELAGKATEEYPVLSGVLSTASTLLALDPEGKSYEEMKKEWEGYTNKQISKARQTDRNRRLEGLRMLLQDVESASTTMDLWDAWLAIHKQATVEIPYLAPDENDSAILALPTYAGAIHLDLTAIDRLIAIAKWGGPDTMGTPYSENSAKTYERTRKVRLNRYAKQVADVIDRGKEEYQAKFRINSTGAWRAYGPDGQMTETNRGYNSRLPKNEFWSKKDALKFMRSQREKMTKELIDSLIALYYIPAEGTYTITFKGFGVAFDLENFRNNKTSDAFDMLKSGLKENLRQICGEVVFIDKPPFNGRSGRVPSNNFYQRHYTVELSSRAAFLNARKYLLGGAIKGMDDEDKDRKKATLALRTLHAEIKKSGKSKFDFIGLLGGEENDRSFRGNVIKISAIAHEKPVHVRADYPGYPARYEGWMEITR